MTVSVTAGNAVEGDSILTTVQLYCVVSTVQLYSVVCLVLQDLPRCGMAEWQLRGARLCRRASHECSGTAYQEQLTQSTHIHHSYRQRQRVVTHNVLPATLSCDSPPAQTSRPAAQLGTTKASACVQQKHMLQSHSHNLPQAAAARNLTHTIWGPARPDGSAQLALYTPTHNAVHAGSGWCA